MSVYACVFIRISRLLNRKSSRQTSLLFFFFNDTATTEIYTLSLHDALPIYRIASWDRPVAPIGDKGFDIAELLDRKSTRLNSSHLGRSYAVFCLKKKK